MIDIYKYNEWLKKVKEEPYEQFKELSEHDLKELIQALSEAKEIFDFQTCDECGNSFNDEKSVKEWLSRYFPDIRKEG